jgi:hypothetical protein
MLGADSMNAKPSTLEQKLGTSIRMLASQQDGEVIAAAHAIVRILKSVGSDIHALAERIEKPNGNSLTEAEMQKLFDAGYTAACKRQKTDTGELTISATPTAGQPGTPSRTSSSAIRLG